MNRILDKLGYWFFEGNGIYWFGVVAIAVFIILS